MTDDRDNSVSSCLFRIVDLMLDISFKDIVMCSILKVLTLHFFLSHTGFWTTQPLYCIRFVAAWKHKSFCLFFYSSRGLCESELSSHFLPQSCVFVLHIFPAWRIHTILFRFLHFSAWRINVLLFFFFPDSLCRFFSSPSPLKKKERVFQYYNPCVSYKPSKFNYTSCVVLLMVEHPLPCLYGDIPFGVNIDMSKWAVMDV